jgi:hypothetical protein
MEANQESGLWLAGVVSLQRFGKCYQQPDRQTDQAGETILQPH